MNSHLTRVGTRVNELYKDLQDGRKLIILLEILSGEKIVSVACSLFVFLPNFRQMQHANKIDVFFNIVSLIL